MIPSEEPNPEDAAQAGDAASAEDADLAGHPDAPVPSRDELEFAMEWAFEGQEITPELRSAYAAHAHFVLLKNREINLTAITDAREVAAKHYLDSWRATRFLSLIGKRVLDLGSGAGFPGIPVALAEPETRFTLLDSTNKRVLVIQEAIELLGLKNAKAVHARGEDHLASARYDIVMMRAVSSVRENVRTLRRVKHALKDLVMWKGPSWSREVRAGERETERLGFRLDTVFEYKLPGDMGERAILVYRAPGGQGG
jgi:16S rRNA (guanine527-N7)-methyltransferase